MEIGSKWLFLKRLFLKENNLPFQEERFHRVHLVFFSSYASSLWTNKYSISVRMFTMRNPSPLFDHNLIHLPRLNVSQFLSIPRNTCKTAHSALTYSLVCLVKLKKEKIGPFRRSLITFQTESQSVANGFEEVPISLLERTREYSPTK